MYHNLIAIVLEHSGKLLSFIVLPVKITEVGAVFGGIVCSKSRLILHVGWLGFCFLTVLCFLDLVMLWSNQDWFVGNCPIHLEFWAKEIVIDSTSGLVTSLSLTLVPVTSHTHNENYDQVYFGI